jgi:hypothetical protein
MRKGGAVIAPSVRHFGLAAVLAAVLTISIYALQQSPSQKAPQSLPPLIKQNIESAKRASARVENDLRGQVPQLWIHVRNGGQKGEVERNLGWFRNLHVGGQRVDIPPLILVQNGPAVSQLRFFKSADRGQAATLAADLRKAIPRILVQDLSAQYGQVTWIDAGHFELWLSSDVMRLSIP